MESPTSRTHFSFPELLNFAVDPENTRKRIADCRTNQQETWQLRSFPSALHCFN